MVEEPMTVFSGRFRGRVGERLPVERELPGELPQDPAYAAFVQPGAARDLHEGETLALQFQNIVVRRGAEREHLLPKFVRRGRFAGTRLACRRQLFRVDDSKRSLTLHGGVMLAHAINEAMAGDLDEKGTQVGGVGKTPARIAKALQHVSPD